MSAGASRRIAAIDIARGLALVGMGAYHLTWDLAYFGVAPPNLPYAEPMRILSHVVGGAFLLLAGVSLGIAHRAGPNWPSYVKRLGIIAAAAALVSAVTYAIAPNSPIFFGILHCILAASLLAAPFLEAPAWLALAAGAAAVVAPRLYSSTLFDPPALLWLGLGAHEPSTLDWRPLLPWAGVTLIGLGLAKQLSLARLPRGRPRGTRGLAFAGRHSLAIYLIHQPVLFGLLYIAMQATGIADRQASEQYLKACRPACVEAGGEIDACDKACACVVQKARGGGLVESLASRGLAPAERGRVSAIVEACGSDAR